MKALAASLGVPDKAITLEDKARNNYENVRFTAEIMRRGGYKTAILVSSPYNMLRSYLLFRKNAPDLDIVYSPIPESIFYDRKTPAKEHRQIGTAQLKAIVHEYLAVIYYKLKSYL